MLARKKADDIILKAVEEGEKIKEEARKKGYEQGLADGRKEGIVRGQMELLDEMAEVRDRMKRLEADYEQQLSDLLETLVPRMNEMIVTLLKNILRKEIRDDNNLIIRTIKAATKSLIQRDKVQLTVNPSEIEILMRNRNEIISSSEMIEDLELTARKEIKKGGAIISSPGGIIDASIDSQLEVINENLKN